MQKGYKGTPVLWLQAALNKKDIQTAIDGDFGSKTEAAVVRFQKAAGLKPDAKAGSKTQKALNLNFSKIPENGTLSSVEWLLPSKGSGYVTYNRDGNDQFGTASTIGQLMEVCREFGEKWKVKVQIGNISRRRGGTHNPHKSHKNGLQVDIRPFRLDDKLMGVEWTDKKFYSQAMTEKFIRFLTERANISQILFNDPELVKKGLCRPYTGHDNHLHISFKNLPSYKLQKWQLDAMISEIPLINKTATKSQKTAPVISQPEPEIFDKDFLQNQIKENFNLPEDFDDTAETGDRAGNFPPQISDIFDRAKDIVKDTADNVKDRISDKIEDQTEAIKDKIADAAENAADNFSPENFPALIPQFKKGWLLGLIPGGGLISTWAAYLANLPDWLVFLFGIITGLLFYKFFDLIKGFIMKRLDYIIEMNSKRADPHTNNPILTTQEDFIETDRMIQFSSKRAAPNEIFSLRK